MYEGRTLSFPVTVAYVLKFEALEFLTLVEALVAWVGAHPELIVHARAYRRRIDGEVGALTGIAELDEVGLNDGEADEQGEPAGTNSARAEVARPVPSWRHVTWPCCDHVCHERVN